MHLFFLLAALSGSALALWHPGLLQQMTPAIPWLLGLIMFGMGTTLTPRDFAAVWHQRRLLLLGAAAQFSIMPLLGWAIGAALPLQAQLGMILVGACPGGTASNVIAYLAGANVALSVTMTTVSTLLAPLLTPLLVRLLEGSTVAVPCGKMMLMLVQIILLPVGMGLVVRRLLGTRLQPVLRLLPWMSAAVIAGVIAIVIALNRPLILAIPLAIAAAVVVHNVCGMVLGYLLARLCGCARRECRTIAIEVGMQNSGLGATLATTFFSATSALPAALFSLWHNISGMLFARWCRRNPGDTP